VRKPDGLRSAEQGITRLPTAKRAERLDGRERQMAGKTVKDVMTTGPRTIDPNTTVTEAARWMAKEDVGPLPVVDGDRLVGLVTDRDLVVRVLAEGRDPGSTTVREACSEDLATVSPEDGLDKALAILAGRQVRRVPVVEGNRLVGIVAQADVARAVESSTVGDIVEQISRS
jgi:CBS domain-containing protein